MKGKRIFAAIIDSFFIFFTTIISSSIISLLAYSSSVVQASNNSTRIYYPNNILRILLTYLLPLLIYFIYYTVFPYLTKGSTLGKLMFGIKVVSLDYNKPTFGQLFIRNIFFFEAFILYIPIMFLSIFQPSGTLTIVFSLLVGLISFGINLAIFIMIISTDEERGLHDYIAKTCVVNKKFDIDKMTQANALERSQMDWAIFEDTPINQPHEDSPHHNEDHIEILNRKD